MIDHNIPQVWIYAGDKIYALNDPDARLLIVDFVDAPGWNKGLENLADSGVVFGEYDPNNGHFPPGEGSSIDRSIGLGQLYGTLQFRSGAFVLARINPNDYQSPPLAFEQLNLMAYLSNGISVANLVLGKQNQVYRAFRPVL